MHQPGWLRAVANLPALSWPPPRPQPRTFIFDRTLPQPSQIVTVSLERPLGLVFEEDPQSGRAVVAELVPGGHAEVVSAVGTL